MHADVQIKRLRHLQNYTTLKLECWVRDDYGSLRHLQNYTTLKRLNAL